MGADMGGSDLSGLRDWERELVMLVRAENPAEYAGRRLMLGDGWNEAALELYRRLWSMGYIGGIDADNGFTFATINPKGYELARRLDPMA